MQTVNISLPRTLAQKLDRVVTDEGYASRSEFVRALVRFYLTSQAESKLELLPFKKLPLKRIESDLRKTALYNEKFVKSVIKGLSRSSVYATR